MSMNAKFVQIDQAELSRYQTDPSLVEPLFEDESLAPAAARLIGLAKTMQQRMQAADPQRMAEALARLDPSLRKQIEESMGRTNAALAAGKGADILQRLMGQRMMGQRMMEQRMTQGGPGAGAASAVSARAVLSFDKEWHGVHYVLCGEVEPGGTLLGQPVLGGVEMGDDQGFTGYGPPRYFTAAQVTELSEALNRPELESDAASRFNAARMSELGIYPGFRPSDAAWVMDGVRRLRVFYADAAGNRRAIVTCLI